MAEGRSEEFHTQHESAKSRTPNLSDNDLNDLANKIRSVGGIAPQAAKRSNPKRNTHFKPAIGNVHLAYKGGHISLEEAQDLNPKYKPDSPSNYVKAKQQQYYDENPNYFKKYTKPRKSKS
jgi:hypothetical protein